MSQNIALGSRRCGPAAGVIVQVGDIVTYTTYDGSDRRVMVDNVDEDYGHPRGPVFDGVIVDANDQPVPGERVWGYSSQVHTIKQPQ